MRRIARVIVLAALLLLQSGAVDRAYSSPARTPNYPGVDVSNGCYMYTDGKIFCNDGGYALSDVVPQYVNQKVQIVLVVEVQGALQVCLAGSCVNASNSETITFPEFGETPYGASDLLQVTCISGPVRWYIQEVNLIPISVPPTATDTPTVNPSSTATNTVVPGSTDTPIPTSTPRGVVATLTPSNTRTPVPTATQDPTLVSCGLGFVNCTLQAATNAIHGVTNGTTPFDWANGTSDVNWIGGHNPNLGAGCSGGQCNAETGAWQISAATLPAAGQPCVTITWGSAQDWVGGSDQHLVALLEGTSPGIQLSGNAGWEINNSGGGELWSSGGDPHGTMTGCAPDAPAGTRLEWVMASGNESAPFSALSFWQTFDGGTPTPGPATSTPSPTAGVPTDTPYPIPGGSITPYPTPTACAGGACAAQDATQIPAAIDTVVGIDTSPLTPLELLSVGRTSCQSFGAIPLVEPHLYGTPIYGSSNPISITWTVPATGTQFQPCADPNFSSAWWDTMWNLSILVAIVCWIGWLIHWVRGLFS